MKPSCCLFRSLRSLFLLLVCLFWRGFFYLIVFFHKGTLQDVRVVWECLFKFCYRLRWWKSYIVTILTTRSKKYLVLRENQNFNFFFLLTHHLCLIILCANKRKFELLVDFWHGKLGFYLLLEPPQLLLNVPVNIFKAATSVISHINVHSFGTCEGGYHGLVVTMALLRETSNGDSEIILTAAISRGSCQRMGLLRCIESFWFWGILGIDRYKMGCWSYIINIFLSLGRFNRYIDANHGLFFSLLTIRLICREVLWGWLRDFSLSFFNLLLNFSAFTLFALKYFLVMSSHQTFIDRWRIMWFL